MKKTIVFWNILLKDIKNYYMKPPNISWGIIFPLAWMLMMFIRTKNTFDINEILPGIITMSILFGTTSMLSVSLTFERKSRSFERLLLSPITIELLILSKLTGAILFGILNTLIPLLVSFFYFNSTINNWWILIIGIIISSILSTLLGLLISVSAKEVFEAQTYSNFFRFPMIFLCGLFIPLSALPIYIKPLSFLLPITYTVDILRYATISNNYIPLVFDFIISLGFLLILFYFSIFNIKRKWLL